MPLRRTQPPLAARLRLARVGTWLLAALSGLLAAVMAFLINLGIEALDRLRFMATLHFVRPGGGFALPWLVFVSTSCGLCLVAALGVVFVSPLAAGSGIPHIKAFCNGISIPGLLTLKTLLVKALGAMFSIGAGLVAGKEGPFIHCGAGIASVLLESALQLGDRWEARRRASRRARRSLLSRGASAGHVAVNGDGQAHQAHTQLQQQAQQQEEQREQAQQQQQQVQQQDGRQQAQPPQAQEQQQEQVQQQEEEEEQQQQQQQQEQEQDEQQQEQEEQQREREQQEQHVLRERRLWQARHDTAAMGAGAGVGAAFIAPLAGCAYAAEEAATHFSTLLLGQAFLAGGVVVLFLWLFTSAADRSDLAALMFESPLALAFRGNAGTDTRFWWYVWEVPLYLLLGLLGGGLCALWTFLNTRLQLLRARYARAPAAQLADVLLCCALTNTLRLAFAYASPCAPLPSAAHMAVLEEQVVAWRFFTPPTGLYPQLFCPDGRWSTFGQIFMLPLEGSVRSLMSLQPPRNDTLLVLNTPALGGAGAAGAASTGPGAAEEVEETVFGDGPLALYAAYVYVMLLLSYGISAPTGIFIPTLAAGAAGGRLAGHWLRRALRSRGIMLPICMPGWSVAGAAALLTGMTRLTLGNTLIVLESSGAVPMTVPLVLLAVPAKLLADALMLGIYDWQIERAGYLFLHPPDVLSAAERAALQQMQVAEICDAPQELPAGLGAPKAAAQPPHDDQQPRDGQSCDDQQQQSGPGAAAAAASDQLVLTVLGAPTAGDAASQAALPPAGCGGRIQRGDGTGGGGGLPTPLLFLNAESDVGTAFAALRDLDLPSLPVLQLSTEGGDGNSGSAAGGSAAPELQGRAAAVVGTLARKDLMPHHILKQLRRGRVGRRQDACPGWAMHTCDSTAALPS